MLNGEIPLNRVAGSFMQIDSGGLDLHGTHGRRAEDIQILELRRRAVTGERLRDVVRQSRCQAEQWIRVGQSVKEPSAGADYPSGCDRPRQTHAGSEVIAVGEGTSPGIAALAADEQGWLVEACLSRSENALRTWNVAVIDARHLMPDVVHRR